MALALNKQTVNFVLDQGATFEKTITAKNTAGGNVTISSGTIAAKLRQSIYSGNNIHSFSTSVSGSNVTLSMSATNTADVSADRRYVYDVEYTQSDDIAIERLAEGIVTISPQSTTGTIVVDTEEETAPKKKATKKKATKKKTTKKTVKDLKAEETRRQDVKVAEILAKPPKSLTKKLKEVAKYTGVEILPTDQPQDVVDKIMAKATEADAVVEEEVAPEVEEEVTPEKEIITVYDPLGKPYEVEVTKRSPKTGYPKIIHPDTGREVLVDGQKYALENPASPDFVLETEGDTPTVSSLNNKKINELIKKYEKQLKAPKKKGERKNVGILLRNVNALKMERNRRAEAKAEPKVPVTKAPKLNKKLSDRYSKVVDETPSKVLRNPDNTLKEATIGDQKFTGEELKLLGAVKNVGGTETYTANPEFKTKAKEKVTTKKKVATKEAPLADSKTYINEGMKKYKEENENATKEELEAENERLAKDWVNENRKVNDNPARRKYIDDAIAVEEAGAFSVVLEGMAEPLAAEITSILNIPTIGIGASPSCDGQILVTEDMLGLTNVAPKFVKKYVDLDNTIKKAVSKYVEEVKNRTFPSSDHIYHMHPQIVSNNSKDQ